MLNKKLIICFLSSFLLYQASAQEMGVGIMLGNPTGLNGKYWLDKDIAIDGGLAYSFGKHTNLSIHSDYLLHNKGALFFQGDHPLDVYYGLGARMEFAHDIELGLRIPFGVEYRFSDQPADVFAEIAPIMDLVPKTGVEIHLAVGARYYFN